MIYGAGGSGRGEIKSVAAGGRIEWRGDEDSCATLTFAFNNLNGSINMLKNVKKRKNQRRGTEISSCRGSTDISALMEAPPGEILFTILFFPVHPSF